MAALPDGFTQSDIESELLRVLHFQGFRKSAVLSEFLAFIVNETMLQRTGGIGEYAIGANVVKRPPFFGGSSIVRTHAVRLRRLLEEYCHTEGKQNVLRWRSRHHPLFPALNRQRLPMQLSAAP